MKNLKRLGIGCLVVLLSACQGLALSPESAATRMLLDGTTEGVVVDQDTLQAPQVVKVEGGPVIAGLTFEGWRQEMGDVSCFYTYQVERELTGWKAGSGGGVCRSNPPVDPGEGMHVAGGHTPGQRPGETGISTVYGWVDDPEIVKLRLTWQDGMVTEADVMGGSLLAVRRTDSMLKVIEGLNEQGQVIHTSPGG